VIIVLVLFGSISGWLTAASVERPNNYHTEEKTEEKNEDLPEEFPF